MLRVEVDVHLSLDHPHVVRLEHVYETDLDVHLVMDHLEGGELFDRIVERGALTPEEAALATRQMLLATAYLHSRRVVHRDMKPENFLYASDDRLVLVDFGFAERLAGGASSLRGAPSRRGTLRYTAPEVLLGGGEGGPPRHGSEVTEKSDLWSLGVVVYTMLCGGPPWNACDAAAFEAIRAARPYLSPRRFEPLPAEVKAFVRRLLAAVPAERPSAQAALELPWLRACRPAAPSVPASLLQSFRCFARTPALRRTCLAMAAWSLPPEERARLQDHFLSLCAYNSGTCSLHEFIFALEAVGVATSEAEALFRGLDVDGDGQIAYSEFLAASQRIDLDDHTAHLTFNRFDADGNGEISQKDLQVVLGSGSQAHVARSFISMMVGEDSRAISFEVFSAYLRHIPRANVVRPL